MKKISKEVEKKSNECSNIKHYEVKYHNDLNLLNFSKFKDKELDLFFALCYMANEQNTNEIEVSFDDLKEVISYSHGGLTRFTQYLESINDKLISMKMKIRTQNNLIAFVLFNRYNIDYVKKKITIQVNDSFSYILNNFIQQYSKMDLIQFSKLNSTYSKNLFRLLKQFSSTGWYEISIEKFKEELGVPSTYRMTNIDNRVLKPIQEELVNYFNDFQIEKIKEGRSIKKLRFSWKVSKEKISSREINEIVISEELNKAIEKAKRNMYIKPFLTPKNILKLQKHFKEDILKKGLNFAYNTINKEFKSLNYLIKTIESSIPKEALVIEEYEIIDSDETINKNRKVKDIQEAEIIEVKPKKRGRKKKIKFSELDEFDKLKVEENSLAKLEKDVPAFNMKIMLEMKDQRPELYYSTLEKYIELAITELKEKGEI